MVIKFVNNSFLNNNSAKPKMAYLNFRKENLFQFLMECFNLKHHYLRGDLKQEFS